MLNEKIRKMAEKVGEDSAIETIMEKIDATGEWKLKEIFQQLGSAYIDTPGSFEDEEKYYNNDIVEYWKANMGFKDYNKILDFIKEHEKRLIEML